jgi:hypothetical protein
MTENIFIKPVQIEGKPAVVPDPETHLPLKAEGEWKPLSMYWARRLRDVDVVKADPPAEKPATAKAPAPPPPPDKSDLK